MSMYSKIQNFLQSIVVAVITTLSLLAVLVPIGLVVWVLVHFIAKYW